MTKNNEIAVVSKSPAQPVEELEQEMNYIRPSTDIYESAESYVILVDMPGVRKESIQVRLDKDSLLIKGSAAPLQGENANVLFSEFNRSGYYRSFNLGEGIDRSGIDARYDSGVLTVTLLKKEEMRPREITIR